MPPAGAKEERALPYNQDGLGFSKDFRVSRQNDFASVFKKGCRSKTPHFRFYFLTDRENDSARLGLILSRRVGNAVVRNWIKRRLREVFRLQRRDIKPGTDILVRVNPQAGKISYETIRHEIEQFLGKNRLWNC